MAVPFFVLFAGLGILGAAYFLLDGNTRRKERYHRPYIIGMGVVFLGCVVATDRSASSLLVGVPAVALISWLNIRNTRFCHACGRTNWTAQWWSRPRYCSACGAALDSA